MTDDPVYRQRKRTDSPDLSKPAPDPLQRVREVQESMAEDEANIAGRQDTPPDMGGSPLADSPDAPFQVSGNVPQQFKDMMQQRAMEGPSEPPLGSVPMDPPSPEEFGQREVLGEGFGPAPSADAQIDYNRQRKRKKKKKGTGDKRVQSTGSNELEGLLGRLAEKHQWETIELPSRGKFYNNISSQLNVRAMTGQEEQILATPRFVRRGLAIDMIFRRCIQEKIDTNELLSIDRNYILIYLRGISYTPEYDVEIKCPSCQVKFSTVIDLNSLDVEVCPEEFGPEDLEGELPDSGFGYSYRLATGVDERDITNYRERRVEMWGDQSEDDTLLYRTAMLLNEIEGVGNKKELILLLKRLPISDVAYLRNEIGDIPFGVDTEIGMFCPSCSDEFEIDLPLETSFFFPRKKERTQA